MRHILRVEHHLESFCLQVPRSLVDIIDLEAEMMETAARFFRKLLIGESSDSAPGVRDRRHPLCRR